MLPPRADSPTCWQPSPWPAPPLLLLGAARHPVGAPPSPLFEATPEADNLLRCASGFRVARMTAAGLFALTAQLLNAHPAAWGWFLDGSVS